MVWEPLVALRRVMRSASKKKKSLSSDGSPIVPPHSL